MSGSSQATALANTLRLSVVESKIARIRQDAAEIGGMVAELRRLPASGVDLRMAARGLRLAALKLDQIRNHLEG